MSVYQENYYLAVNLKNLRRKKKLSRKQVGEYIDVSHEQISKYENSENIPSFFMMIKLSELFCCSLHDFCSPNILDSEINFLPKQMEGECLTRHFNQIHDSELKKSIFILIMKIATVCNRD